LNRCAVHKIIENGGDIMGKTGRRIWYGIAIFLACLVVLISAAGIIGVWVTQSALSSSIVQLLDSVSNITGSLRQTTQTVDQKLASMQDIASSISTASESLSQQVADQGLIKLLLPEEQTTQLSELSTSVKEAITTLQDTLTSIQTIYQTIDSIPFVNLPSPSQEQIDKVSQSITTIQSAVDEVTNAITTFRAGASEKISLVTQAVDQLNGKLTEARNNLAELDSLMANVQDKLAQLQQTVVVALVLLAILESVFLVWVIYTQVEVIRLYALRWRASGAAAAIEAPAEPTKTSKDELPGEAGPSAPDTQENK
jgi:methyl-accepting chemotaxis protein